MIIGNWFPFKKYTNVLYFHLIRDLSFKDRACSSWTWLKDSIEILDPLSIIFLKYIEIKLPNSDVSTQFQDIVTNYELIWQLDVKKNNFFWQSVIHKRK